MASFTQAYYLTMSHEGGYAANLGDGAGETYKGITRRDNPTWEGWAIIDRYKRRGPVKNKILYSDKALETAVQAFYKKNFWDAIVKGDEIKAQQLANFIFDFVVNAKYGAVKQVNKAATALLPVQTNPARLSSDTLQVLNRLPEKAYAKVYENRENYYRDIVADHPNNKKFLATWLERLRAFPSYINYKPQAATQYLVQQKPKLSFWNWL